MSRFDRSAAALVPLVVLGLTFCLGGGWWFNRQWRTQHTKWDRVRVELRAIARDEQSLFARERRMTEAYAELRYGPASREGYIYVLSPGSVVADSAVDGGAELERRLLAIPPELLEATGVRALEDGGAAITVLAAGDLDGDPTIDVWSVSTEDRVIDGRLIPSTIPFRHVDDSEE